MIDDKIDYNGFDEDGNKITEPKINKEREMELIAEQNYLEELELDKENDY